MQDLKAVRLVALVNSFEGGQLKTHAENAAQTGNVAVVRFLLYRNKQLLQHMHMRRILHATPPCSDAIFRVVEFTEPLSDILHKETNRVNVLRRVKPRYIKVNVLDHSSDMLQAMWFGYYVGGVSTYAIYVWYKDGQTRVVPKNKQAVRAFACSQDGDFSRTWLF